MRDIKITIPAGQSAHQEVAMRAWLVRAISADDVVRLETQEQGSLLLHAGQEVDLDSVVGGFDLVNKSDADVVLHLQVAGKATLGSKKNGADSGGTTEHIDQVARDAAAVAVTEADEAEMLALDNAQDIGELRATGPFSQVLQDSGRLCDFEPYTQPISASNLFNGSSAAVSTSRSAELAQYKFTHNNSTNGGTLDANDALVESLLDVMGRDGTKRRFGLEFYIAEREFFASPSAASKRVVGGVDYFLGNTGAVLLGFDGWASAAQWVYSSVDSDLLAFVAGGGQMWVNGIEVTSKEMVLSAGWHHVAYTVFSDVGYVAAHPRIYGKASAIYAQALPVVSRNKGQIPVHTAPVPFN